MKTLLNRGYRLLGGFTKDSVKALRENAYLLGYEIVIHSQPLNRSKGFGYTVYIKL